MIYNGGAPWREHGVMADDSDDSQKLLHAGHERRAFGDHLDGRDRRSSRRRLGSSGLGRCWPDRYQIEATLGQGGSGTVYRAWDRVLAEPIAIKILRPDRARERSWIMRLAREVKVARAIRHPNVCRVFELGHADGHWFVTMELGTAGRCATLLEQRTGARRRGRCSERLVDARAISAGLAAIHAVGIIHRDVTPQNVLRMDDGRLVISDFGLAIELTATTTLHGGTPNYMPPETLLGRRDDQRSDVWQLGVILHELFFGRRPVFEDVDDKTTMRWPLPPEATPVEEELARLCADCLSTIAGRASGDGAGGGRAPGGGRGGPTAVGVAADLASGEERLAATPPAGVGRPMIATASLGIVHAVQIADRPRLCRAAGDRLVGVWDPASRRRGARGVRSQRPLVRRGDLRQRRPFARRLPRRAGAACTPRPARRPMSAASSRPRCSTCGWPASAKGWAGSRR